MPERNEHCTVAVLRPSDTSWGSFSKQLTGPAEIDADVPYSEPYNEGVDEWLDEFQERILEISDQLGIRAHIEEYQLFEEGEPPGRQQRKTLENDAQIVTTIDPSDTLIAYIHGMILKKPDMRAVLAFSKSENMESSYAVLGTSKIPCYEARTQEVRVRDIIIVERTVEKKMLPKIFAFPQKNEVQMAHAVRQSLRFPYCDQLRA